MVLRASLAAGLPLIGREVGLDREQEAGRPPRSGGTDQEVIGLAEDSDLTDCTLTTLGGRRETVR